MCIDAWGFDANHTTTAAMNRIPKFSTSRLIGDQTRSHSVSEVKFLDGVAILIRLDSSRRCLSLSRWCVSCEAILYRSEKSPSKIVSKVSLLNAVIWPPQLNKLSEHQLKPSTEVLLVPIRMLGCDLLMKPSAVIRRLTHADQNRSSWFQDGERGLGLCTDSCVYFFNNHDKSFSRYLSAVACVPLQRHR